MAFGGFLSLFSNMFNFNLGGSPGNDIQNTVGLAANGGPVPGSEVAGYTTPAGYNKFDYRSGGVPVRVGAQEGGIMETEEASEIIVKTACCRHGVS